MSTLIAPPTRVTALHAPIERVMRDLYRDVHKGLRNELFAITAQLGVVDPADDSALTQTADRMHGLFELLDAHARHEDDVIGPALDAIDPTLNRRVISEHAALDAAMVDLSRLGATALATTGSASVVATRRWYLAFASFTSDYLAHEATEELEVSPVLSDALGLGGVEALEQEIIAHITPDHFGRYLRLILPAANPGERADLLGGIRLGAPAEVFAASMEIAAGVLSDEAVQRLVADLG
jgi:hypothetical protein